MTGNVLKEIEENIKDYEEQGIEQIPLSLVKYWISVLGKENEQLKKECYGNLDGLNYYQEQNGHLSSKISDLECENEQLKEENEFAKLLANHRGEMVSFANSLIQDIDDELTQKMWYQFKEEMYQKWKKKRGIE